MKKAHQALLRYLNLDLASTLETFKGFVSDESSTTVSVPYRHCLDYIIIRLQGLARLLIRIVVCIRKCAAFFLGLIKAGSFYAKGVVFISTLASVWSQSREFCKFTVRQYNQLSKFRDVLKEKPGAKWVDGNYEVPTKLEDWLGSEYDEFVVNETYDIKLLVKEADLELFSGSKNETLSVFSRIISKNDGEVFIKALSPDVAQVQQEANDELELEDFAPIPRKQLKSAVVAPVKIQHHSASSLSSKDAIQIFVRNETSYRKVDKNKSITINKMKRTVWKEFRDDIKNKLILMQSDAFVDYVKDYLENYNIV